jgi:flavin reductase (DIM6/NTAB) family NADH-FMN oxidoreductase RutF
MEAQVHQITPIDGTTSVMVLGRVVRFHLREDLLQPDGLVDPVKLNPVGRLGGDAYASLGEVFAMQRAKV